MELVNKIRLMSCFQNSLVCVIPLLLVTGVIFAPGSSFGAELPPDYLPHIQILEIITTHNNRTTTENLRKDRNSDVVVGEDTHAASRILMKCNATYPVQWVYLGDGRPEFTTFTNVKWQESPNVPLSFEAEASLGLLGFQGVLREEDTGNYTCRSIQEPTVNSYYYIYVPGDGLFASPNGTNITYTAQDQFIRIPCGVSHPKATVTLCKKDKDDKLTCPVTGASGFNTKGGFLMNLKKQRSSSGTYVCTASYQRTVKIVEHHVMRDDEKPKDPSPAPPPPTFSPKPGANLCDPSPCGKQAECSVVNGRAVCYCFRGLNGNPYDECAPGKCRSSKECPRGKFCRQGQCTSDPCNPSPCGNGGECSLFRGQSKCSCMRGYTGLPPNCVKSCVQNEDCSENEACIKAICQSPCPGPCGQNAECRALINGSKRTAQCSCPTGYLGDPLRICYKFNTTTPGPWNNCPPGYVGIPPACQRRECRSHLDCQFGRKCVKGICDKGMVIICPSKCGVNAECVMSSTTSDPICICPAGTSGNPAVHCYAQSTPTSYLDSSPSWGTVCQPNPCKSPAECQIVDGNRMCVCPSGFAGDPSNCVPISTVPAYPPSSSTCRYAGDCKSGDSCIEGRCQDMCNGICGYMAVCEPAYQRNYRSIFTTSKLLRSTPQENTCSCPAGYEGNPYVSCTAIQTDHHNHRHHPPSALPPASTSAEPICFPNPCARYAECTPFNNAPLCRCQPGFDGNPYVSCTEIQTDPPPPPSSTSAEPICFPNPCGRHAECTPFNNAPLCRCRPGFEGNPYDNCSAIQTDHPPPPSSTSAEPICFPNPCGRHAECTPVNNAPLCTCRPGFEGNPYDSCTAIQTDHHSPPSSTSAEPICFPNPCGRHAECTPVNNAPLCKCRPGFEGNPYQECRESIFSPPPTNNHVPLPRPTQHRETSAPPNELDYQGHSWGRHIDDIPTRDPPPPISQPPSRDYYDSIGGSRFSSRQPPSTPIFLHTDTTYASPPQPSAVYDDSSNNGLVPIEGVAPSYYPTTGFVQNTPTPRILDPPMSPLTPLAPPEEEDECSFKNPYADYDMDSCGVGRRCERDFKGVKRCVCISPFDCTGPTSIYARNKCKSSRDCLMSEHICINGTCGNPCSPEFSPCAGIAYSECRVIEGNVLCTCRRGYVGNPASGLDCRPKRNILPSRGSIGENHRKFILIHSGFHNVSGDFVININHLNHNNISSSNNFNLTDYDNDDGSVIISSDGSNDDDDIIINAGAGNPRLLSTTRHHRRHYNNDIGIPANKINNAIGHCGFGTGHNCDEKSHCRVVNGTPRCVCKVGYQGEFPSCKPECEKNEDCPDSMACQYHQCMDPCIEEKTYCTANAICRVVKHLARCECEPGYNGVPWIQCSKVENTAPKPVCMGFNCQKKSK